jgi:hypothetical protein
MSKVCTKCKEEKAFSEFFRTKKHSSGRKSWCKLCCRLHYEANRGSSQAAGRKWYSANKEKQKEACRKRYKYNKENGLNIIGWLLSRYEGTPCMDCATVFPWRVMEFDHRPEEQKAFGVSSRNALLVSPETIAEVEKEIAKCDLVCANCHRIRTADRYEESEG